MSRVAIALAVLAPGVSLEVVHRRRIDGNLTLVESVLHEEALDLVSLLTDALVERRQVVAHFRGADAPRHLVGRYFPFGQSLDGHETIFVGKVVDATLDAPSHSDESYGKDDGFFHSVHTILLSLKIKDVQSNEIIPIRAKKIS